MLEALVAIGIVLGYSFMAGIGASVARGRSGRSYDEPDVLLPAMFWPLALPAMLGVMLVERTKARRIPRATVTKEQGE